MDSIQIRRAILRLLYDIHEKDSEALVEEEELAVRLQISLPQVHAGLSYLFDKGFVQLPRTQVGTRTFNYAKIGAQGIDLLEDESEFNRKFPPSVQGDYINVNIGNNAKNIAVGKEIDFLQLDASSKLEEVDKKHISDFQRRLELDPVRTEMIADRISRLRKILGSENLDLGEVQRILQFLFEQEGEPATITMTLFSHPSVSQPIQRACQRLIGHN